MSSTRAAEENDGLREQRASESMIPILPCGDIDGTVDFYQGIGFALHHRQAKPYPYLAFSWRAVSIHLGRTPDGVDRASEAFACLIAVDDVTRYHDHFAIRLRELLGRVPSSGRPRLTRLRPGASRFTLVDPNGNNLIFVRRSEPSALEYGGSPSLKGLAKALDNARILRDFREDQRAAFRALDSALRRPKPDDQRTDRATALVWMIELAPEAGADDRISDLMTKVQEMRLSEVELDTALSGVSDQRVVDRIRERRRSSSPSAGAFFGDQILRA